MKVRFQDLKVVLFLLSCSAFEDAFDISNGLVTKFSQNPSWNLLAVCYPPTPKDGWGVDEHTDLGFLTILNQDQVGGLEVKEGSPNHRHGPSLAY